MIKLSVFFCEEKIKIKNYKDLLALGNLTSVEYLSNNLFVIDDYCVDCKRGTISRHDEIHSIEPKVMAVLLHLAVAAREVVEQEYLFDQVWPTSIYSPGSVRRCVTVLRKVFQDDDKSIIATHPKRGYSLNSDVSLKSIQTNNGLKDSLLLNHRSIVVLLLLIVMPFFIMEFSSAKVVEIEQATPITSTGQLEDFAKISPNGKYMAFVRSPPSNHKAGAIWLKDMASGAEYQLSTEAVYARNITWHKDSNAFLYVSVLPQGLEIVRMTLKDVIGDVDELTILQRPQLNWIGNLGWGKNNKLFYVFNNSGKRVVVAVDLSSGSEQILMAANSEFDLYSLSLSSDLLELAIIGRDSSNNSVVKIIALDDPLHSDMSVINELALDDKSYEMSWHPNGDSLLLNNGRQLYQLFKSGEFERIDFENFDFIRFAHFSPNGETISVVLERLDLDILVASLQKKSLPKLVLDSNAMERGGRFSPLNNEIVFISESKGFPQIFIHDLLSGENRVVYQNDEQNLYISPPVWNADGDKLAFAVNDLPTVINLADKTNSVMTFSDAHGIPLQWFNHINGLLLASNQNGEEQLLKYDLKENTLLSIGAKSSRHSYLNNDDLIIEVVFNRLVQHADNGTTDTLHRFNGKILRHVKHPNGIYIYEKLQDKFILWFFSFSNVSVKKIKQWSVNQYLMNVSSDASLMLVEDKKVEKDIVFLSLK